MVSWRVKSLLLTVSVILLFSLLISSTLPHSEQPTELYIEDVNSTERTTTPIPETVAEKVRRIVGCEDKSASFYVEQKGDFFVLYNFVLASARFACEESITYTTQGDFTFFDNVPNLVSAWQGPISLAVYAPGDDFKTTIASIAYLRSCENELIRQLVTFHIFFPSNHFPENLTSTIPDSYVDFYNCSLPAPYLNISTSESYRRTSELVYPINVARNVARLSATTHFVFASDIELYPSPNFIDKFLQMIADHPEYEKRSEPRVYALPIFEILEGTVVPTSKTELQALVKENKAMVFHAKICLLCHMVPLGDQWLKVSETNGLKVFTIGKRMGKHRVWEAFYVGTNADPIFDERISWEGQSNKMVQGYALCLLNYDYMVLDNAFLIHKPGVKKSKEQTDRFRKLVYNTNSLIKEQVHLELIKLYGRRKGCYVNNYNTVAA